MWLRLVDLLRGNHRNDAEDRERLGQQRELIGLYVAIDRRLRSDRLEDLSQVRVGHDEELIRRHEDERRPSGPEAVAHRALEILVAPRPDFSTAAGRQVPRVELPERWFVEEVLA